MNKRGKAKELAGGGGRVAHSAAFWEKVKDNMQQEKVQEKVEEKRKEEKERLLPGGRKIQSSAAFWEQMAENIGCKWEGEELDEGDKKWEDKGRKWEEGGRKWEGRRLGKSIKDSTSTYFHPKKLAQKTRKSDNIQIRDKTA